MPTETPDRPSGLTIGDVIAIKYSAESELNYFKILNRDTLFYPDAHSALASGSTETYAEVTNLNPPQDQIYQFTKIELDGNVKVYLKQPAATNRWGTQKSPAGGYLTDTISPVGAGEQLNVWVLKDYVPNIQLVNSTNVSITPNLFWYGWRYQVQKMEKAPPMYTLVVAGGPGQ